MMKTEEINAAIAELCQYGGNADMHKEPQDFGTCLSCDTPLHADGGCYYPECSNPTPWKTPQPEPAKDEWRVGYITKVDDQGWLTESEDQLWRCSVYQQRPTRIICHAYGKSTEEAEAIAKRIVEDHNQVEFLQAAVDCGASGWTETLKNFKASIDENQKLHAELEALRKYLSHAPNCRGAEVNFRCDCGLSALLSNQKTNPNEH